MVQRVRGSCNADGASHAALYSETCANAFNFATLYIHPFGEVKAVTALTKTTIYGLLRAKSSAAVRLGQCAIAWAKSEVRQWAVGHVHASQSVA